MPHIHCYLGRPGLVWTMFSTDLLIGMAYVGISLTLWGLVERVKIKFSAVVLCFGIFILACGLTHFMEVWTLWNPDYWIAAFVKLITAVASVGTGIYLWKLRQPLIEVAEAVKLSEQRRLDLEALTEDLEQRVEERTRALQLSEARFKTAFMNAAVGVAINDLNGCFLESNPTYSQITGYTEEELKKKTYFDITHPEDRARVDRVVQTFIASGEQTKILHKRYMRKNGEVVWAKVSISLIRDEKGIPVNLVRVVEDITQRKRAQEELLESEIRFRALADNIPQLAWMSDNQGDIFWYNQRWYDYTGTTFAETKDHGWKTVHQPEHLDRVVRKFHESLRDGKPWEDRFPLRRKDGTWRWFLSRAVPIRDSNGEIVQWFGTNTDITDELTQQEKLTSLVKARDEFISIASHELKTPLTTAQMQIQILDRKLKAKPDADPDRDSVARVVAISMRQLLRINRLVEDMLDISRLANKRLNLEREEFDLGKLIEEVADRFQDSLARKGSKLKLDLEAGVVGVWDRFRIDQVISNLFLNALKYAAGELIEISLRRVNASEIELIFRDHGPGIASEDQGRIFERFERAIPHTSISGLGLGLYIIRQIIRLHGGAVRLESPKDGGAKFIIDLPSEPTSAREIA